MSLILAALQLLLVTFPAEAKQPDDVQGDEAVTETRKRQ